MKRFYFEMMSRLDVKEDGCTAKHKGWDNYTISVLWTNFYDKKMMSESVKMNIELIT